jgi:hypothetical protein
MGSCTTVVDIDYDDILLAEAMRIAGRLAEIRTKLVTISDKTSLSSSSSTSTTADAHNGSSGGDVTEEEMKMANEAQGIMKRLGEIKAQLSSSTKSTKKMTKTTSQSLLAQPNRFLLPTSASFPSSSSSVSNRRGSNGSRSVLPNNNNTNTNAQSLGSSSSTATHLLSTSSVSLPAAVTSSGTATTMMVLERMEPSGSEDDCDDDHSILPTEKASNFGSPQAQPVEGMLLQKSNIITPTSQTSLAMEEEEYDDDDDDDVGDLPSLTLYHREEESRNPDSEFNDDRMLLLLDDYDDEFHHGDMENIVVDDDDEFYNTSDSPAPYDQPTRYLNVLPNDRYYYYLINHHHVMNESRNNKMVPSLEPIASFDSSESTTSFSGSSSSSDDDENRHAVVSSSTCTSGGKTGGVDDHHHDTIPLSKQQRPNAAYDPSSSMAYDTGVSLIDNTILDSSVEESEDNIVFLMEQLDQADADLQKEEEEEIGEPKRNPTVPVMASTTNNKNDCNNEYNAILSSLFCGGDGGDNNNGGGVSSVGPRQSSTMTMTTPSSPKIPSWWIEGTKNNANYENDGTIESSSSAVCTAVGTDEGLEYSLEAFLGYGRGQNLVVQPLSEDL